MQLRVQFDVSERAFFGCALRPAVAQAVPDELLLADGLLLLLGLPLLLLNMSRQAQHAHAAQNCCTITQHVWESDDSTIAEGAAP